LPFLTCFDPLDFHATIDQPGQHGVHGYIIDGQAKAPRYESAKACRGVQSIERSLAACKPKPMQANDGRAEQLMPPVFVVKRECVIKEPLHPF
jgi:hypothetical protein